MKNLILILTLIIIIVSTNLSNCIDTSDFSISNENSINDNINSTSNSTDILTTNNNSIIDTITTKSNVDINTSNTSVIDVIAPAEVSNFHIISSNDRLILKWNNPQDEDFYGVKICKTIGDCDSIEYTCSSEITFFNNEETWTDYSVIFNNTYCYKIFTFDKRQNFSSGICQCITVQNPIKWIYTRGNLNEDYVRDVTTDDQGNIYICGYYSKSIDFGGGLRTSVGSISTFVVKFDSNGNYLWDFVSKTGYADDKVLGISVDKNYNVIVAGFYLGAVGFDGTNEFTSIGYDTFAVKLDSNGSLVWVYTVTSPSNDLAYSIKTDNDGNVYIAGYYGNYIYAVKDDSSTSFSSNGLYDSYVFKFDKDLNFLWGKSFGSSGYDIATKIALDSNANVFVTGTYEYSVNFGGGIRTSAGNADIFIIKYDSNGNYLWDKTFGSESVDEGYDIMTDNTGNCFVTGYFHNTVNFGGGDIKSKGNSDIFIAKYDPDGNYIWHKTFGSVNVDRGIALTLDNSNNVYLASYFQGSINFGGGTKTSNGDYDFALVKLDVNGNYMLDYTNGGIGEDTIRSMTVNNNNELFIAGRFSDTIEFYQNTITSNGNFDLFLLKLDFDN